jgi:hypothetical protein
LSNNASRVSSCRWSSRHDSDDLAWILQLFTGAYDEIVATHIDPRQRQATDPSAANHLKYLLGSLMVGAFQIGRRGITDNPAVEAAIAVLHSHQASRARAGKQLKSAPLADERRRAIIEVAGGDDKLRRGSKYASAIRSELERNPKFKELVAKARGYSTSAIRRAIEAILEERKKAKSL